MKKITTLFLAFMLITVVSNSYAAWTPYTFLCSPDSLQPETLLISFPSKPSHDIKKGDNVITHKIKLKFNGTTYFLLVSTANVDVEAAGKSAQDVYSTFSKKYTKVSKSTFSTKNKRSGISAKLSKDNTYINYRALVVNRYIFQLMAIKSGGFTSDSEVKKFFESFEFLGAHANVVAVTKPNGNWTMRTYGDIHLKASFPEKPKYTKKDGTNSVAHRVQLTTDDGITYAIIGTKASVIQDVKMQDEVYSGFAKNGQIKAKKVWRLAGKTGIKAKLITSGGAYVHYRVIVVDDTILQFMVIGNKEFAPQEKADKFFSHLQLMD